MYRLKEIIILMLLISLAGGLCSNSVTCRLLSDPDNKYTIHWQDKFNKEEKAKVEHWLEVVNSACTEVLGEYPFKINFNIYKVNNAREPVPWAQTVRSNEQGVNFHIDPDFTLEEFLNDWTAPHEISHLSIPFLGPENMWFAEGYATYMQGQILIAMKEFSKEQIEDKFQSKLRKAIPYYQSNSPFIEVADSLKNHYLYPELYWGSATYFASLNNYLLEKHGSSLTEIISEYQSCCRLSDDTLSDLMKSFNKLIGDPYASDLLESYKRNPARDVIIFDH